jgi:hypothetical protein
VTKQSQFYKHYRRPGTPIVLPQAQHSPISMPLAAIFKIKLFFSDYSMLLKIKNEAEQKIYAHSTLNAMLRRISSRSLQLRIAKRSGKPLRLKDASVATDSFRFAVLHSNCPPQPS